MELAIVGLPQSGKTTVFNALTKGKAERVPHPSSGDLAPHIGVVKVPDPRLEALSAILKPKRTVPAEVTYLDIAVPARDFSKGEGLSHQLIPHLSRADALIHVVRTFDDESVPHLEGSVDPLRDIATMEIELTFSDLGILERRLHRLEQSLKGAKQPEREAGLREQALLNRIKTSLEKEMPLRRQGLSEEESKSLESYQFLTAKPTLVLLNLSEDQLAQAPALEEEVRARYPGPHLEVAHLPGKLEMELSQLSDEEAQEFRAALEVDESALDRVIRVSYALLGLISFFTTASNEVKAWTIRRGTSALKAAGKVHTDMERGFIRAEAIGHEDLMKCGSIAEARKRGLLRVEGKSYTVQDGDVLTILFHI